MEKWIRQHLTEFWGGEIASDLTRQILQMDSSDKMEEYLISLLDLDNPKHAEFLEELLKRQANYKGQQTYTKKNNNDNNYTTYTRKQNKKKNKEKKEEESTAACTNRNASETSKPAKPGKGKTEFVNLYSNKGRDRAMFLSKGRRKCDCEAKEHCLINNCTNCGRIVCEQEGSGPCFFCGELVCSTHEMKTLSGKGKQAAALYNKLMNMKPNKNLEESMKHRDRLLEYDRTCTQRTRVIDDEADYFETNSRWLAPEERKKLQKLEADRNALKHASRLETKKMTLDFAGRQVREEKEAFDEEIFIAQTAEEFYESMAFHELENSNICPSINFERPTYIEQNMGITSIPKTQDVHSMTSRIQDKEYLEMVDSGHCLSMHQPYASLLVTGIKKHEGRTWYTSHRGRLWIAATAKPPSTEEITHVQHFYRVLKDEKIKFPDQYPTSCLLGCVTVVDCLPQEEYRKMYPEMESDSPYVFICENPYALPIKFPIQGKHKIYKLDSKIHQAAMKSLEKLMKESKNSNL